jgi:hypothetical protein
MKKDIQLFNSLPDTRAGIKSYVIRAKEGILKGNLEPFYVAKMLKSFEEIVKQLRDDADIKIYIENESDKYHEKTIDAFGAKFTKQERPYYDYSGCNDSYLSELYSKLDEIKEQIKEREEFLKHVPDNFVNSETGEIIQKPIKTIKTIISVTLK